LDEWDYGSSMFIIITARQQRLNPAAAGALREYSPDVLRVVVL
jgi:hypothetical protein